ncbi:MAG: UMP kinase [Planctomycetes bacterium]|nr:UMP kinase [Planctomycetota bacterium]
MAELAFKRVLLKISGESLGPGGGGAGLDVSEMSKIASEIVRASKVGAEIVVVVGAGNILRGSDLAGSSVNRASADYLGMLATVINAVALSEFINSHGGDARVLSAISVRQVCEPFIRDRAISHLRKGRTIILAAGTGNPYFTTDTAAAQRAAELEAQILLKATKVDGVYDSDPKKNPGAKRYEKLTYLQTINEKLRVMDLTAISLCMDNNIPILVFDYSKPDNIVRAVKGERIGTLIS